MWSIRSFLNTDTPSLSQLWTDHFAASGLDSHCSVHLWDQCVLSKVFFRAENLLLAIDESGRAVGMIHFGPGMCDECSAGCISLSVVHQMCVAPGPHESDIAADLLARGLQAMRAEGHARCVGIGSPDASIFYLGVAHGDNLMGVPPVDTRVMEWLQGAGFQPSIPTACWELELSTFRPPMDRNQIAIRRSCSIGRILEETHPNWWINMILGHCDQVRFHLLASVPPRYEMEVLFWYPDATMRGVDASTARLQLPAIPSEEINRERLLCLIAEASRQLQQERKRTVRVVVSAQQQSATQLLQRLGFRAVGSGLVMSLALDGAHGTAAAEPNKFV